MAKNEGFAIICAEAKVCAAITIQKEVVYMITRERVEEILKESGVLLEGHFLLTSGRHSNKYMQCAKIFRHTKYIGWNGGRMSEESADRESVCRERV